MLRRDQTATHVVVVLAGVEKERDRVLLDSLKIARNFQKRGVGDDSDVEEVLQGE